MSDSIYSVTISKLEYEGLLEAAQQLEHLYAMGVDSWEGYSHYADRIGESEEDIYGESQ